MKKSHGLLLTLALIVALAPAGMAQDPKPAPSLVGVIECDFAGHLGIFDTEGRLLGWEGTISGDIEGQISWWMYWPPKFVGQTNHFVSRWEILDSAGVVLLAGYDAGVTRVRHEKNSVWWANGTVTEASAEFEDWIGRPMHEGGSFTWAAPGLPDHGTGIFRVN